jgi:gliding motility-associated-like protein
MRKFIALVFIGLQIGFNVLAQKPEIVSVDKLQAATGSVVTIDGNELGTNAANLKVFFGAAPAQIKNIANQIVQVYTPSGATFDNISVTNTSNGLTSYAPQRFFINFSGEHGLTADNFTIQTDFAAESGLYDLCSCDFNNDGKVDIASVGEKANTISFFINGSSVGNINLARTSILVNAGTLHVTCGDLNGDGKPEIVASENNGDRIFILKNNGNSTFSTQQIKLTGNKVKRVAINDLDLDGKPELVITDQLKKIVTILSNQSSLSGIAFGAPLKIDLPAVLNSSDGLDIQDLNADGLPEIITSHILSSADNKIFILVNKSSPGNFNFDDKKVIVENNAIVNIRVGDLDQDGKPDFAVTRILNSDISIYRNTSTTSDISFADPIAVLTNTRPWGLDFGDLDGDGKLDIAVASIENKAISILNNTSTAGSISFAQMLNIPTTFINKHIRIGDIDGDAKPDLTFTSIDNGTGTLASKISVIRNKSCMLPEVLPLGPLTICQGSQLEINATISAGTTYQWLNAGTSVGAAGPNSVFTVSTAGTYSVTATNADGCNKTSNVVTVNFAAPGAGLNATPPNARNNGPVCSGDPLTLQVSDVGATSYRWSGPNGFGVTTTSLTATRDNFQIDNAGLYVVEMLAGSCVSKVDSTIVQGVNIPEFSVNHSGSENICQGESKILSVSPLATSGFAFQWFDAGGAVAGATTSSLSVSQSGNYHIQVTSTNAACAPVVTNPLNIVVVAPPQAAFTVPAVICLGTATEINNQSVVDTQATPIYAWTMGTNDTKTGLMPEHTYTSEGDKTIALSISYDGVTGCIATTSQNLKVVSVTQPDIKSTSLALCPSDSAVVSITGDYKTIIWSNNADTQTIVIKTPGDYTVSTTDVNDCVATDVVTIGTKELPVVTASAPKEIITLGESVKLKATIEQPLNQNATYAWSPKVSLDDSTKAEPLAKPEVTTIYTVKGTTADGCSAEALLMITVATKGIGINPAPLFSPNNDGTNDNWVIQGVLTYPDCTLNIFDSKGRRVYEKKGYQNDWNAQINGNPLPDGVYYFVFGCTSEKPLTGTVTVVR